MRFLIVANNDILQKGEYDAEAVVILFAWGYISSYQTSRSPRIMHRSREVAFNPRGVITTLKHIESLAKRT